MKKIWFLGNCKDEGGVFLVAIILLFGIFGICLFRKVIQKYENYVFVIFKRFGG